MATKNRYEQLIEAIFLYHHKRGVAEFTFKRTDIEDFAEQLGIKLPKNLGDVIYSFRYRVELPDSIRSTAPKGKNWIILPAGKGIYKFALSKIVEFLPNEQLAKIKIPDATPGIISSYAFSDEQALLAKLRYNRLIDIFTHVTCYSLQNHLRTTVPEIDQVETDEIYVGINRTGSHFVIPVQAKGGKDKLSIVQIQQDFALCANKFPDLICRPIGAQFLKKDAIVLFEFIETEGEIKIASEKHYRLVSPESITANDLEKYKLQIT